jgi:hypothetical protein
VHPRPCTHLFHRFADATRDASKIVKPLQRALEQIRLIKRQWISINGVITSGIPTPNTVQQGAFAELSIKRPSSTLVQIPTATKPSSTIKPSRSTFWCNTFERHFNDMNDQCLQIV